MITILFYTWLFIALFIVLMVMLAGVAEHLRNQRYQMNNKPSSPRTLSPVTARKILALQLSVLLL